MTPTPQPQNSKEESLSDKIVNECKEYKEAGYGMIHATKVRESIKKMKRFIMFAGNKKFTSKDICNEIDKIFGPKLT